MGCDVCITGMLGGDALPGGMGRKLKIKCGADRGPAAVFAHGFTAGRPSGPSERRC